MKAEKTIRARAADWHGARWIWRRGEAGKDEYVDFLVTFEGGDGAWRLNISADSNYNVYINGELSAFGQYADYPERKVFDRLDVSPRVRRGCNRMVVRVWYYGVDSQTYLRGDAGLIFALERDGEAVAVSSATTLSRLSRDYVSGQCQSITSQLGLTFCYDSTQNDGYLFNCDGGFASSIEQSLRALPAVVRPVRSLVLGERCTSRVVSFGAYRLCGGDTAAERMSRAQLSPGAAQPCPNGANDSGLLPGGRLSRPDGYDGIYAVFELEAEASGFLELELSLPTVAHIDIGYGEHLRGGVCPVVIGGRGFGAEYVAQAGENRYINAYRRLGGRYVQIFVPAEWLEVAYVGIRPTLYPLRDPRHRPADELRRRIYDTCVNTLRQCMHEHYEDCPWREQALYTMDSRNQMLCGYYAFGEYEFPRASLWLISQGLRPDGLLSLCYPAGLDYPIPSFSLIYFIQMREYIEHSGDTTLARELYPMLRLLMRTFTDRRKGGLVPNFPGLWNFYEWSRGMSGRAETERRTEAPLNALLVLALESLVTICERLGDDIAVQASEWREMAAEVRYAIFERFYDAQSGLFLTSLEDAHLSVLTQALCLLCGAADGTDKRHILKIVADNGGNINGGVIEPATLSMNCFRFDALLRCDRQHYGVHILGELDRVYGFMLSHGATSFWETINGASDFGGAGSLCHGWSALPIYYYSILDSSMTL